MISVYYSSFGEKLDDELWCDYINMLTPELRQKNNLLRRWQDKHAHLFGKILLLQGLKEHGFSGNPLQQIQYTNHSRPFLKGNTDFNISHAGEYVVCAIGHGLKLGVDVEKIQDLELRHYKCVMNTEQWHHIYNAVDPARLFFRYWTMKECLIKADGRGLSIPLDSISIAGHVVTYQNTPWFYNDLALDANYSSGLVTNESGVVNTIKQVHLKLLNGLPAM